MPTAQTPTVLVVDDQAIARDLYVAVLAEGFTVLQATNGREALRQFHAHRPDVVLLDITMPEMDGFETLSRIRDLSAVPVIMVTAHGEDAHVVRGLDAGADDYIVKPIRPSQLAARVRAAVRGAAAPEAGATAPLRFDGCPIVLDRARRMALVDGRDVVLSATEYRMLETLMEHAGHVLSQDQILDRAWGPEFRGADSYVKTYAWLLRVKLEKDPRAPLYLRSRRGFGYVFDPSGRGR